MNPEFDLQTDGPVKSFLDWSFESKIEHLEKVKIISEIYYWVDKNIDINLKDVIDYFTVVKYLLISAETYVEDYEVSYTIRRLKERRENIYKSLPSEIKLAVELNSLI